MLRYLKSVNLTQRYRPNVIPTLIRTASKGRGKRMGCWKIYRDARNITSHTYNEDKAVQVCRVIPDFA